MALCNSGSNEKPHVLVSLDVRFRQIQDFYKVSKTLVFATGTYTSPLYLSAKLKLFQNSFHKQNFKNNPFNEF